MFELFYLYMYEVFTLYYYFPVVIISILWNEETLYWILFNVECHIAILVLKKNIFVAK